MKSPFSDKEMELKFERRSFTFRKEEFEIMYHYYYESDFGEEITNVDLEEINQLQVYNQYRAKHNLPFPDEITAIREKYNIKAPKMSALLGFGTNMYRNYENGEVPSESNARLIQLAKNPESFKTIISLNLDISEKENQKLLNQIDHLIAEEKKYQVERILESYIFDEKNPSIYSGFKSPNLNLLKEMVVFFTEKLQPDKTILIHLLFHADFLEYKKSCYSISGSKYNRIENIGPMLFNSNTLFDYMRNNHDIDILFDCRDTAIYEKFIPRRSFNKHLFKTSQLATLNEVLKKYSSAIGATKIDKCDIPESITDQQTAISYDMSYSLDV